ncbi:MAG: carbohydrate kinase family protein [Gemmatimonadota bacterium]|nr:carbohydrate kinase family protein [Gemmatimonadota bacterium]MDE3012678.1 carbohydrate kinase family protein [Gemmatimonadota bacterium]
MTRRPHTLGIVGTMVFDRILPTHGDPVEGWGGIGYAVAAASATLPADWGVRVVARIGADLFGDAERLLSGMPRCELRLTSVPEPNNCVELHYRDAERRTEVLSGGVSGWSGSDLAEALTGCDAVLLNFISGHELDLAELHVLHDRLSARIYADVHSLFLGVEPDGTRSPRTLDDWGAWFSCFDIVQMNEDEFALLRASPGGPDTLEDILEAGPRIVAVTRGSQGATVAARADGRILVQDVTLLRPRSGDPTGCGDIWGAVMYGRLLAGTGEVRAVEAANRVAAASLDHHGVEGLVDRLADVPLDGGGGAFLDSTTEVAL